MEESNQVTIWTPNKGFQERFIRSDVDFLVAGSAAGVGKTAGALMIGGAHSDDPNFRMLFLRRNIGDLKAGGGGTDEALKIYNGLATFKISDSPRMTFPSGAFVDFTHMSDQTEDKVLERIKGWQYSCIYVDEATGFEWSTIRLLMSRNRSQAKWTGKMRLTCNPKRNHWLRKWVDWYVDEQGFPIPERDGIVRYFFVNGKSIDDVVFGDSKEDVYRQCRTAIDDILRKQDDDAYSYKDLIKSTTFYTGKLSENKALMSNDSGYLGSLAAMGEKQRMANMLGCWNVDLDEDAELPISPQSARQVAFNAPQTNGVYWVTADLADTGTDNTVILVWDGYHIVDRHILQRSLPERNVEWIKRMALKYNIPDNHIIYDAQRAPYMLERMPNAIPYYSFSTSRGLYKRDFQYIKDECFMRMVEAVNGGRLSFDPDVANSIYEHQKIKDSITFLDEFVEECHVVQFYIMPSGKHRLYNKKEMNHLLGRSRSMDVVDPISMRFSVDLMCEYGQELAVNLNGAGEYSYDEQHKVDIYDESFWC